MIIIKNKIIYKALPAIKNVRMKEILFLKYKKDIKNN
jgi:hypothetical protein